MEDFINVKNMNVLQNYAQHQFNVYLMRSFEPGSSGRGTVSENKGIQ